MAFYLSFLSSASDHSASHLDFDQEFDSSNHSNGRSSEYVIPLNCSEPLKWSYYVSERRFATFKLFYYGYTPNDYEPPHFRAGDAHKDKWFFSTHDVAETPERCSIGTVKTGFHGVDVRVASVAAFLPSAEDNSAPFMGTTHSHNAPALTPLEEIAARAQQLEAQRQDALERRVLWDADNGLCDEDAEGEDDPECAAGEDLA